MKKFSIILLLLIVGGLLQTSVSVFGQYGSVDEEIKALNDKIQEQKKQMDSLTEKQKAYQVMIEKKRQDQNSLVNQLSILGDQTDKTKLDIDSANINIDKTNLEIKKIQLDMENVDTEINTEKDHISNLLRLAYKQDQVSTLEMLLLNNSLAEFLNQAKYLENTDSKIKESLDSLKNKKDQLEKSQESLDAKNKDLASLKLELEKKVDNLQYEQDSKGIILEETKSSEAEYQNLLAEAKKQQLQAEAEVYSLEKTIRQKMSEKDKVKLESGSSDIAWPISGRTITTGFHDPDYPYRKIIGEHPAIDIRSPQGSTLRAAADGYVARVKFDGSTNYAYIMIIHNNGLSTVYGHVSAVSVVADQYVHQGDVIGRTGGAPHGVGSGPFTTGAHLHFEVRKDGIPVNPVGYLPQN
ncbi:MAG: peptidoglycan DD-metalloendopeptidase family protein [Candidatus Falkowbacteria bacterium]